VTSAASTISASAVMLSVRLSKVSLVSVDSLALRLSQAATTTMSAKDVSAIDEPLA
jgi:hypothetical protein